MTRDRYDIAIVGAGPAGMAAAVEARRLGLSVAVLDDQPAAGGQILRGITRPMTGHYEKWGQPLASAFQASGAAHLPGAAVWAREGSRLLYSMNGETRSLVAGALVLATGSMERPAVVAGNTLPSVVTVGALQSLMKGSGCVPAGRFVLAGNGPLLLLCAIQFAEAGARPAAIIQTTPSSRLLPALPKAAGLLFDPALLMKGLGLLVRTRSLGIPLHAGARDIRIDGTAQAETIRFRARGRTMEMPVDLVALHDGVVPNDNLAVSLGAKTTWNCELSCYELVMEGVTKVAGLDNVWAAGDSVAIHGGYQAMLAGRLAALDAAHTLGFVDAQSHKTATAPLLRQRRRLLAARRFLDAYYAPTLLPEQAPDDATLCRCEEVSVGTVRRKIAEGAAGTRALKAATRCGMGPCQGRQCTVSLASLLAHEIPHAQFERPSLRVPARPITVAELAESHLGMRHTGSDA